MAVPVYARLDHIAQAIDDICSLLAEKSIASVTSDRFVRAAFERFLEIISEASRHVPEDMKLLHPEIAWQKIAGIGNQIRHAYDGVNPSILWTIYETELTKLSEAIAALQRLEGEKSERL